ncbi:hypothetical protein GG344DRAFT_79098 [Lentinula edodes]|nr:hypothetical protein GG344DRAFT_79098 [Lentinula edodes]
MYLQHSIRPHTFPSNKISKAEEGRTSLSILPINNFDHSIRYLQRTLLGFDADNLQISFSNPGFLPWQEQVQSVQMANDNTSTILVVPGFESLYIKAEDICYVNYLPVELLREIFLYLLPGRDWMLEETPPPQLVFVQVCKHWRNIAISYPTLWSTFMIIHPIERHIPMTKLWLERSGNHPLTIYIDHRKSEFEKSCSTTDVVINLLRPHIHRWKAVTFILTAIQSSLLALPRDEYPLLETFCFDVTGSFAWNPESVERVEEKFFPSSSPMLREVTWETHGLSLHKPPLAPTNITYLSGDFFMDLPFFDSISELKNLRTLRLHGGVVSGRVPPPRSIPLVLPHLRALEVRTIFYAPFLLDSIATPSLKVLVMANRLDEKSRKSLCSLISRSRCHLSAFSYLNGLGDALESEFFEEFLLSPHMDSLSELNLLVNNADAVLRVLVQLNTNSGPVLPSLNRLWLSTHTFSGDLLLDMLECRATDFHPPTGAMMSEPLFSADSPYPSQYLFIPVSRYSLCLQVTWIKNNPDEVFEWFKTNAHTHWNLLTEDEYIELKSRKKQISSTN